MIFGMTLKWERVETNHDEDENNTRSFLYQATINGGTLLKQVDMYNGTYTASICFIPAKG